MEDRSRDRLDRLVVLALFFFDGLGLSLGQGHQRRSERENEAALLVGESGQGRHG
jgi:hypothetical protein